MHLRVLLMALVALAGLLLSGCQTLPWLSNLNTPPAIKGDNIVTGSQNTNPDNKVSEPAHAATGQAVDPLDQTEAAPVLVWQRMLDNYQLEKPDQARLQREYDWYRKHPSYFERVQNRAAPLLHFILNEIEARNMPGEIVLLPVVESAYQPFAYSPGRAAGLWQFIPSTGRMYGLEQNWWYDGRRDIVASTRAALDYLQAYSRQFDGDWELALAAYNAGGGTVRKAIRKNRRQHKPTDYWSLDLPRETEIYVPRLLAISKLFADAYRNPAATGIQLQPIEDKPQLATVDMDRQIDLALAAELAQISIDDLYRFNPAFNRWATLPDKPYQLLLPIESAAAFESGLANIDPDTLVTWQRYRIKSGDTLSQIAKRHATTTTILKEVNELGSSRIRAGKHLLIPVAMKDPADYKLSQVQRQAQSQIARSKASGKGKKTLYTVQPGDNLWDIARAHGVSHKRLAQWNGIATRDLLRPGQQLVIWRQANSTISGTQVAMADNKRISNIRYTIRKGDSLSRIASRFNVSVSDLKKWNQLNQRYLQPGQTLKLKVDVTEQL